MRIACDTGGTFTDLLIEDNEGVVRMYKASTTPQDPISGVLEAVRLAAEDRNVTVKGLLVDVDDFIHGTTHAINAIITGNTAKTAFLTTYGHPDILVLREGGRKDPFDHELNYLDPFIPRSLTYEIKGRMNYSGEMADDLNEDQILETIKKLKFEKIEAVAVCLLWSISNSDHELRIGSLLEDHLPGVPYTLSHQLNPCLREFRRAISTAIDASLKPMMSRYLGSLKERLAEVGFSGRLMIQTSQGGMVDGDVLALTPIHSLNSGPALAPIAGIDVARMANIKGNIIVADTGGTTYDVSLARDGIIPLTQETWIGRPFEGHMTGFPSIDVKSVGAGGGSIAWIDDSKMLHVGPESAGADPGPACFGRGGTLPSLTDASLVLGYIDAENFLGGAMVLDLKAAREAVRIHIADPLGIEVEMASLAIYRIATENMVQAITDITVKQGIDPSNTVLIGGGGAAGLNSGAIAKRLRCGQVILPNYGPCLSAAGALLSDIKAHFNQIMFCNTAELPFERVFQVIAYLRTKCMDFATGVGSLPQDTIIEMSVDARYPNQVWEITVPVDPEMFESTDALKAFRENVHNTHKAIFGYSELDSEIDIVSWNAVVRCQTGDKNKRNLIMNLGKNKSFKAVKSRLAWFDDASEALITSVYELASLEPDQIIHGPAIIESNYSTTVLQGGMICTYNPNVGLIINIGEADE